MSRPSDNDPKSALFAQFAAVAKALAHPHRLALLEQLAQGERSVEVLADRVRTSVANASQHLQQIRRAGLAASRRKGKYIYYRLSDDTVLNLLAEISRIAAMQSAEVDRVLHSYFHARDALETVSRNELLRRLDAEAVIVLDVRPRDEYELGHLPGAVNVELSALAARIADLDPDIEVVAYCRGPYCVLSYEAVAMLRSRGFRARRLQDGYPEWRAAGLPTVCLEPAPS